MNENSSNKTILEALPEDYTFNLSDFALFLSVMKNKTAYENTLSIILDEPDLKLKEVKVEQVVLNESGKRAIRLDAWAREPAVQELAAAAVKDPDSLTRAAAAKVDRKSVV